MKRIFTLLTLALTLSTFAQETGKITGKVIDANNLGEALIFAQISLKNTDVQAETNFHGNFSIDQLIPGPYTLVINYAGYDTKEIPIRIEKNKTTHVFEELESKRMKFDPVTESRKAAKAVAPAESPGR